MILIIGGAYQGKLAFAKTAFSVTDDQVHICVDGELDFSKRCICNLEVFAAHHADPVALLSAHRNTWQDSIFIMQDIFCGVVPLGQDNRAWRRNAGRLAQYLSREAAQVYRVFCGLEQRLK